MKIVDKFDSGYVRSPVDHRDYQFMASALVATANLPEQWEVDARKPLLESDQGSVPSCLAHCFAYVKTIHERKDKRRTLRFDPAEFYNKIALLGGGAYFRDAFRVAQRDGLQELNSGKYMKIGNYYAVNPRNHVAVREAIISNRGLAIGFGVTRGWAKGGGREFQPTPGRNMDEVIGGHGMFVGGYTSGGPTGINSWGPDWGNEGRAFLPWDYWDKHVWECWAIQDVND